MNQNIVKPQRELAFGDYFRILVKNKYILLFAVVAFMGPTWWFIKTLPDFYITSSQMVIDEKPTGAAAMLMESQSNQKDIGYYRALLQSAAFLDRVIQGISPQLVKAGITKHQREYVNDRISMAEGSVPSFISISAKTNSAEMTYALVKTATDSLIIFCRKVENEESEKAIAAIKEQIEVCVKKREEIQQERNKKTGIAQLNSLGDAAGLAALEKNYQDELVKFELDKANLEAKRSYFMTLDNAMNAPVKGGNDSAIENLRSQLKILEKEKEKMTRLGVTITPDSKVAKDIQSVEERLAKFSKGNDSQQDIGQIRTWQALKKEISANEGEMKLKRARLEAFK